MAKLSLDFACALYDRMQPLYTGEVQVDEASASAWRSTR